MAQDDKANFFPYGRTQAQMFAEQDGSDRRSTGRWIVATFGWHSCAAATQDA